MVTSEMWTYQDTTWSSADLIGYEVEASDGGIRKIDRRGGTTGDRDVL